MKKRANVEERMAALKQEIEALETELAETPRIFSKPRRRMLAGKRAALHVMENNRTNPDYCKEA